MSRIAEALGSGYGYPAEPGSKEKGGTSEAAAAGVASKTGVLRDKVLQRIREAPSTADEVAAHLGESVLNVRPRVSELQRMARIVKTGERRPNASGAQAWVWRAARW